MLQKRDFGARKTEPIETPAAGEVDWNEWWVAIDKRIQEHLVPFEPLDQASGRWESVVK